MYGSEAVRVLNPHLLVAQNLARGFLLRTLSKSVVKGKNLSNWML